jgi:outer membrane protein OmpA-like peptidoglycan-associated protein/uncharacterized membrane protein YgcG
MGTSNHQRGASLVEAVVVLPLFLFLVLAVVQAALVFYARSNANYAAFEAARAGSVQHASLASIQRGFAKGMVPYYGGGRTLSELGSTAAKVAADMGAGALRIEIVSPTRESFVDFNSPSLQTALDTAEPVIPNVGLDQLTCPRDAAGCASDPAGNASGQSLLDANLLKLRITYGIPRAKQMPLAGRFYTWALNALRAGDGDAFKQTLIDAGRIPVVVHTTLRMQSDAIRNTAMVSSPGPGNHGTPTDRGTPPGDPPTLPRCGPTDPACSNPSVGPGSGGDGDGDGDGDGGGGGSGSGGSGGGGSGGGGGGGAGSGEGAVCRRQTLIETGSADVLFDFDGATINAAGRTMLDQVIANMRGRTFDRLTLTGYTDPLGDAAYNEGLSQRRADAVRNYLLSNGLNGRDIRATGRGEQDPVVELSACPAGASQVSCLAPNRRVVFTFEGLR